MKFWKRLSFIIPTAVVWAFSTTLWAKDKIVIGQAWPLSGPLAPAAKLSAGTTYEM